MAVAVVSSLKYPALIVMLNCFVSNSILSQRTFMKITHKAGFTKEGNSSPILKMVL